ncbi:1,4-alpha-glucan branching protein [Streptomyces sp. RKND-216]|uniref:maltokinase N-terminal cap-like domain-containing protein n=1 Tax=Streptomyces sp. RKND-216 TaxID=2562581 RepID=UPI00109DB400|nr:1,4-alpha-glucan branching protein [Streptomyces sp. RKND-216]THA26659.1 1,4-alpha-glucan branching protein [Streptomyces sp. RKND-216]
MSVIHRTTMTPTKLELVAAWLPGRPWYAGAGSGRQPELAKAGGFRLDDPAGEVGIEFMVVTDASGERPVAYHLPLSYRGAPLDGAEHALLGTSEHGVLGRRWIYDGVHDPVLVAQVLALLRGRAEPQAQSESDTPDPAVTVHGPVHGLPAGLEAAGVAERPPQGTGVVLRTGTEDAQRQPRRTLTVARVLPDGEPAAGPAGTRARVSAPWHRPDGTAARSTFLLLEDDTA